MTFNETRWREVGRCIEDACRCIDRVIDDEHTGTLDTIHASRVLIVLTRAQQLVKDRHKDLAGGG